MATQKTVLLDFKNALEHQNHEGVIRDIEEELAKVGIVLDGDCLVFITAKRMVFLCLDGASVNMGSTA